LGTEIVSFKGAFEGKKMFWQAFPHLTMTIEELIAERNKIVVRFIGRGTHQGDT
jgi:predicted ester cyclase